MSTGSSDGPTTNLYPFFFYYYFVLKTFTRLWSALSGAKPMPPSRVGDELCCSTPACYYDNILLNLQATIPYVWSVGMVNGCVQNVGPWNGSG
jgi:hypothetical protein